MILGLGPYELLIILAIVIFFYGGKRLAQVGDSLGKSITEFKKAIEQPPQDPSGKPKELSAGGEENPHRQAADQ